MLAIMKVIFFQNFLNIMWLVKENPLTCSCYFYSKNKVCLTKIFNIKLASRPLLASWITFMLEPKINKSSTYRQIITWELFQDLWYMHLSHSFVLKPFSIMQESNFSCHCFGACFKLYRDLVSLHTLLSWPASTKHSGWSI